MIIKYAKIAQNRRLVAVAALAKRAKHVRKSADVIAFPSRKTRLAQVANDARRTALSFTQLSLAA